MTELYSDTKIDYASLFRSIDPNSYCVRQLNLKVLREDIDRCAALDARLDFAARRSGANDKKRIGTLADLV